MSKLFDKMKGAIGNDTEKAVIEATLHTAREPPPEQYVRRLVLGSANGENSVIAAALKKRLDELDWKIVLKALIVTHVLTREGDLQFTAEMLAYSDKFRSGIAHTQSTFVRPYSQYIGARLKTFSEFRTDYERDPQGTKGISVVDKYAVFGAQMDALLACKTEGSTNTNALIFAALQLLVRDSMRLYQVMTAIVSRLIEEFPRQSKDNMQKILNIYRSFITHTEGLNAFYEALRHHVNECPQSLKLPPTSLRSLEEYMNNPHAQPDMKDPPLEKLTLNTVGQPLQVQHTGVFAGAQPIFTGANPVIPNPANNPGGAPQYPQAVRQQSMPQMGANPFAATPAPQPYYQPPVAATAPAVAQPSGYSPYAPPPQPQPMPNPFAAPGVSYTSPTVAPAPAQQPKYPTPPSPVLAQQTSFIQAPQHASPPYSPPPAQQTVNPFAVAAKPAPPSPPQAQPTSSGNLMAIAAHLQNPTPGATPASPPAAQWAQQPAAQPSSPFAPVAPQYTSGPTIQTSAAPQLQQATTAVPSANVQAQFTAAAGQQQMLFYRLPTGEFVAVPASALQGMQLSAAPPPQQQAVGNPFGN